MRRLRRFQSGLRCADGRKSCQDDAPLDIPFKNLRLGHDSPGLPLQKNICVNCLYIEKMRVTLFRLRTPQNKSITIIPKNQRLQLDLAYLIADPNQTKAQPVKKHSAPCSYD